MKMLVQLSRCTHVFGSKSEHLVILYFPNSNANAYVAYSENSLGAQWYFCNHRRVDGADNTSLPGGWKCHSLFMCSSFHLWVLLATDGNVGFVFGAELLWVWLLHWAQWHWKDPRFQVPLMSRSWEDKIVPLNQKIHKRPSNNILTAFFKCHKFCKCGCFQL